MSVGKAVLGVLVASLVITIIFFIPVTMHLGWLEGFKEVLKALEMAPLVWSLFFLAISLPTALLTELLRFTKFKPLPVSTVVGLLMGFGWSVLTGFAWEEGSLSSMVLCPLGVFSGIAYWFIVHRNDENPSSLAEVSLVTKE